MRRLVLMVMVLALASAAPVLGQEITVTGELVDHACFTRTGDDGRGPDHAACAIACAQIGQPVGLVTEDGEVYVMAGGVVADNNALLVPHMSHIVEVTGEVTEANGVKTLATDVVTHISEP